MRGAVLEAVQEAFQFYATTNKGWYVFFLRGAGARLTVTLKVENLDVFLIIFYHFWQFEELQRRLESIPDCFMDFHSKLSFSHTKSTYPIFPDLQIGFSFCVTVGYRVCP